jgi:hypothetical protein
VSKSEGDTDASVTGHLNDEVAKDAATKNEPVELSTESSTKKRPEDGAAKIVTSKGDSGTVNMDGVKSEATNTNNAVADSDADAGAEADKKGNVTINSATKLGPETEDVVTIENDRKEDEEMECASSKIAEPKAKDRSLIQAEEKDKTSSVTAAKNEPTAEGSIDVIKKEDRKGEIVENTSTKDGEETKSETDSTMQVDAKDEVVDMARKDQQEANSDTITGIQTDMKGDADDTTKKDDKETKSETDSALQVYAQGEVVDSISRKNEVEAKSETISGMQVDTKGVADADEEG